MAAPNSFLSIFSLSVFTFLIFVSEPISARQHRFVPVFLWATEQRYLSSQPAISAGEKLSSKEFQSRCWSKILSDDSVKNVFVFIQEKLSIEEITEYSNAYSSSSNGGAYKNLRKTTEENEAVFVPAVDDPLSILKDADAFAVHTIEHDFALPTLKTDGSRNLVLVHLPPVRPGQDQKSQLVKIDEIVGKFVDGLQKSGISYLGVFTGKGPSHVEQIVVKRFLRAAGEAGDGGQNYTLYNHSNCILLYAEKVQLDFYEVKAKGRLSRLGSAEVPPEAGQVDHGASKCLNQTADVRVNTNMSAVLVVKFPKSADIPNVKLNDDMTMSYNFTRASGGDWKSTGIDITFDLTFNESDFKGEVTVSGSSISGPKNFSYHCDDTGRLSPLLTNETGNFTLGLSYDNFQVQAFDLRNLTFSRGYDCQVFFTIPIWSGIIVSLLLTWILLWGLGMISQLRTMDRFDDPKGKTIQVPQEG